MTAVEIAGTHPYADKFPLMTADAFGELCDSIESNGLRQAIVLTADGLILDGRNRYAACKALNIEPATEVYEGDDLAEYVIDCNSSRRHMSTGARAMATALVLVADNKRSDGRWDYGQLHGSVQLEARGFRSRLNEAGAVLDHAPDLAEQVTLGELALDAAYKQALSRRDAERQKLEEHQRLEAEEADAKKFILDTAPDLADQVGDDQPYRTYAEALAIWEQRNREEAARRKAEEAAKKKREEEARRARSDLYTGMATALSTCANYGGYTDVAQLMADYNPAELDPPYLEKWFEPDNLRAVQRLASELISWQEAR